MSGGSRRGELERLGPAEGGDDVEILAGQLGLEQLDVRQEVVDDQDPRRHGVSSIRSVD